MAFWDESAHRVGFVKVRYRGIAKNAYRLVVNFALANLYLHRRRLLSRAVVSLEVRIFGSLESDATETNGGYGPFDYAPFDRLRALRSG
jgi:hypothetical protein